MMQYSGGHPGGAAASVGPEGACASIRSKTRSKKSAAARRAQRYRAMARLQNWAWYAGCVATWDDWHSKPPALPAAASDVSTDEGTATTTTTTTTTTTGTIFVDAGTVNGHEVCNAELEQNVSVEPVAPGDGAVFPHAGTVVDAVPAAKFEFELLSAQDSETPRDRTQCTQLTFTSGTILSHGPCDHLGDDADNDLHVAHYSLEESDATLSANEPENLAPDWSELGLTQVPPRSWPHSEWKDEAAGLSLGYSPCEDKLIDRPFQESVTASGKDSCFDWYLPEAEQQSSLQWKDDAPGAMLGYLASEGAETTESKAHQLDLARRCTAVSAQTAPASEQLIGGKWWFSQAAAALAAPRDRPYGIQLLHEQQQQQQQQAANLIAHALTASAGGLVGHDAAARVGDRVCIVDPELAKMFGSRAVDCACGACTAGGGILKFDQFDVEPVGTITEVRCGGERVRVQHDGLERTLRYYNAGKNGEYQLRLVPQTS